MSDLIPSTSRWLEPIGEALDRLHVSLGHARLYGYEHPRTMEVLGETREIFLPILEARGTIELVTQPEGLFWEGVCARSEAEDLAGLGRLLHREGIAALSFEQGLPMEELAALLGVLRINLSLPENEEETLDSLLWQMGFSHISYRAVRSLAEAEALSGGLSEQGDVGVGPAGELFDYHPGAGPSASPPKRLSEDALMRAVAGSDLGDLAPKAAEVLRGLPDREWERLFSEESEDREAMAKMRADIERETSGDLASTLFYVLLQSAAQGRQELHTSRALDLALELLHHLEEQGGLQGLGRILADRPVFLDDPSLKRSPSYGQVVQFLGSILDAATVVRILLRLQPGPDLHKPALDLLLYALDDEGLAALVQAAVDDDDAERRQVIFEAMGRSVQDRVERFVTSAEQVSAERALATMLLLRALNSERGKAGRRAMLRHGSSRVREAAAAWYCDDLPSRDVDPLLECLLDRDREVRKAAAGALEFHRPFRAISFFRKAFAVELERLDGEQRRELCVACGRICGDRALELLVPLFEAEASGKGRDKSGASLQAAAFGLAAVGSVQAFTLLKKGAGGWGNRARKAACNAALESVSGGQ